MTTRDYKNFNRGKIGSLITQYAQSKEVNSFIISKETGISVTQILKLMTGESTNPTAKTMVALCKCLEIPWEKWWEALQ